MIYRGQFPYFLHHPVQPSLLNIIYRVRVLVNQLIFRNFYELKVFFVPGTNRPNVRNIFSNCFQLSFMPVLCWLLFWSIIDAKCWWTVYSGCWDNAESFRRRRRRLWDQRVDWSTYTGQCKSLFSFLRTLTTWHCPHLHAAAATVANCSIGFAAVGQCWDWQTNGLSANFVIYNCSWNFSVEVYIVFAAIK